MQGYDIFDRSLNGIRSIRGDNIIAASGTYQTLTTNTLSLSSLISNLTQGGVYSITQTGSGSNSLKDSIFTNISISGNLTSNLTQSGSNIISQTGSSTNQLKNTAISGTLSISGNLTSNLTQSGSNISQTGSSTNQLKSTTVTGQLGLAGNLVQTSGSNTLQAITMPAQQSIVQQGSGTGSGSQNTFRTINMPTNGHVITQGGNGSNTFKQSNFSAAVSIAGNLSQTSGSSTLLNLACGNINQSSGSSIIQSGTTSNSLGSTTISNLIVSSSMSFPGSVTIPSATISDDFTITGDGRILQDQTSLTVNILKSTNIKSLEVQEDISQSSGTATLCDVVCDSLNTKEFNLLDSGGSIVVSDSEMRFLAGVSSGIQSQLNSIVATDTDLQSDVTTLQTDVTNLQTEVTNLQTEVTNLQTDVTTLQSDVTNLQTVNDTQTTNITDLRNDLDELQGDHDIHVSNSVLINSDQIIGGNKSFSNNLTTNGIQNTGSITTDQITITPAIKTYTNTMENVDNNMTTFGTSNINVIYFDATNFRRGLNVVCPISAYATVQNGLVFGGHVTYDFSMSSFSVELWKDNVFDQTLTYSLSSSLPCQVEIEYNSTGLLTVQYFLTISVCNICWQTALNAILP
ncbi:MAG: hypothetical protein EOP48_01210 [Sphingobacteriales bacterium]|nr:MAG: hypothetical protein EOP48_01210 [Sphingobacteriales bacterium]